MHQTFYIDIDEEITSIIERLRKAQAKEIVIVAPKRALLIQSIVNLRILKKEADDLGLALMIVTQDKLGKLLIEKAGILVQQKLDDEGEEIILSSQAQAGKEELTGISGRFPDKHRLEKIGSREYFDEAEDERAVTIPLARKKEDASEIKKDDRKDETILNQELVSGIGDDIRKRKPAKNVDMTKPGDAMNGANIMPISIEPASESSPRKNVGGFGQAPYDWEKRKTVFDTPKDKKIENFFDHLGPPEHQGEARPNGPKRGGNARKVVLIFFAVLIVFAAGYGAYAYLPKADINVTVKAKEKTVDTQVRTDVNANSIDYDKQAVPGRLVSANIEASKNFSTSGTKSSGSQKAHGKVTLINDFSASPQPLVATTRLLTPEGKLFRLVSGVTIPGMGKSGEQAQSGTVEAEVIADEAGDSYNIGATTFTIPGFKDSGNDKYSKIYAKSTEPMIGGGTSGSASRAITQEDINNAKTKIMAEMNSTSKQKLKELVVSGEIMLDDAVQNEEAVYKTTAAVGQIADEFEMKAEMKSSAIVFKEADLKNLLNRLIANSSDAKVDLVGDKISLDFGKADADYKMGTLDVKVKGTSSVGASIDAEKIKRDIAGKTNDELTGYLKTYPGIEKVEINYWPPFISGKVPDYPARIEISIDTVR